MIQLDIALPDRLRPNIALLDDALLVHWFEEMKSLKRRYIAHDRRTGEKIKGGNPQRFLPPKSYGKVHRYATGNYRDVGWSLLDGTYGFYAYTGGHSAVAAVATRGGRCFGAFVLHGDLPPGPEGWFTQWQGREATSIREKSELAKAMRVDPANEHFQYLVASGPSSLVIAITDATTPAVFMEYRPTTGMIGPIGLNFALLGKGYLSKPIIGLQALARSADGSLVAFGYDDRTDVVDGVTGDLRRSYSWPADTLSFAPDGLTLAIGVHGPRLSVTIIDLC